MGEQQDMSKEVLVFIFGIVIIITPFLGIPRDWQTNIIVSVGVLLVCLGYLLRRAKFLRRIARENGERRADSFVERSDAPEED